MRSRYFAVAILIGSWACDDPPPAEPPAPSASGSAEASSGKGLLNPRNHPEVVALARAASRCPWVDTRLAVGCSDLERWRSRALYEDGRYDATLLNLLDDDAPEVRWLAASTLEEPRAKWSADPASADRVLEAARSETDPRVALLLGKAVGTIHLEQTKRFDAVSSLLKGGSLARTPAVREGAFMTVQIRNTEDAIVDTMMGVARSDPAVEVRSSAVRNLWQGREKHRDEICKLWLDLARDPKDSLSSIATLLLARWPRHGGCKGRFNELFDALEERAEEAPLRQANVIMALGEIAGNEAASPAHERRALKLARGVVEARDAGDLARRQALKEIGEHDPAGKTFARGFTADHSAIVAKAASEIVGGEREQPPNR